MFTLLKRILQIFILMLGFTVSSFAQVDSNRGFFSTLFGFPQRQEAPTHAYSGRGTVIPNVPQRGGIQFYEPGTEINPATGLPIRNSKPLQRKSIVEKDDEEGSSDDIGSGGVGSGHYCVRTCDGFFFPIPAVKNAKGITAQEFCQSLCPFSEVEHFKTSVGGEIDDARNKTGRVYTSLATAFAFREKSEKTCTCRGGATRGLARIDYRNDFTLKAGDILVFEQGAQVFAGSSRFPYANIDFVSAAKYSKLPNDVRVKLVALNLGPRLRVPTDTRLANAQLSLNDGLESSIAPVEVRIIDIFNKKQRQRPSILIELIQRRA